MTKGRTILVAEHDRSISALIEEILLGEGYTVRRCASLPPTIYEIERAQPDGVIVDIGPGDADTCMQLLQQLRQSPALRNVGVLLSSTDSRLLNEISWPTAQMRCATLPKPFDLHEFISQLSYALDVAAGSASEPRPPASAHYSLN